MDPVAEIRNATVTALRRDIEALGDARRVLHLRWEKEPDASKKRLLSIAAKQLFAAERDGILRLAEVTKDA